MNTKIEWRDGECFINGEPAIEIVMRFKKRGLISDGRQLTEGEIARAQHGKRSKRVEKP